MAGQKPAVEVTGVKEFQRAIGRMRDDVESPELHRRPAEAVRDRARDLVPRVSGALGDTIDVVVTLEGAEVVAGSPTVPYAGVIEYGWPDRNIEADRYLRDAASEGDGAVTDRYAARIGQLVERVGRES